MAAGLVKRAEATLACPLDRWLTKFDCRRKTQNVLLGVKYFLKQEAFI
jgi:hypothetical protein